MCSKTDFSPCLCPPWSSVFALVCPLLLAPPSGVCTGWTGCSWWRGVLQTGCVSPREVNTFIKLSFYLFIFYRKEREKRLFRVFFLTSSLKFLKAATLSSTLSWLRGRSFKRSITWHKQEGAISTTAGLHVKHTVISKTKKRSESSKVKISVWCGFFWKSFLAAKWKYIEVTWTALTFTPSITYGLNN